MIGRAWFLVAGFLFAAGLALSGMTQPAKVSGFLDFAGDWDPSLAFVMLGAVGVFFVAHRGSQRLQKPLLAAQFPRPPRSRIDRRLVLGAAAFGIGWGLSGFCPGPALVSVGAGARAALWFVPAMIGGMWLFDVSLARLGHAEKEQGKRARGHGGEKQEAGA
jgi:uncharacterized protein